ncbi:MAG: dockerin type I domain-containing protein [Patescibacteria group bacterium]
MNTAGNKKLRLRLKAKLILGIIVLTGLLVCGGYVLRPTPVHAQVPGFLGRLVAQPTIVVANPWQTLKDAVWKALKTAGDIAYKNTLRAFLNKAAYESAVYIASGGTGQRPLFYTNPGKAVTEAGDAAVGDFLDNVSKHVFGKSLCEPIDIQTKVRLDILARNDKPDLRGRCPLTKIGENLENSFNKAKSTRGTLIDFSYNFNPEASEFGAFITLRGQMVNARIDAEQEVRDKSLLDKFQAVTDKVSGFVKTPAPLVEAGVVIPLQESFKGYTTQTGTIVADAFGIFTNTLVSKLLQQIFIKGFNPQSNPAAFASNVGSRGGGIAVARSIFSKVAQPDYVAGGAVDIVSELSSCPPDENYNNCIIDSRFAQAVQEKLTLQEAIDRGLIDGNKTFGFTADGSEPEYLNGYPYRSLVMLRKYRIVPAGWELAAQYIKNYSGTSFSLKEVMDRFNFCGQNVCSNSSTTTCTLNIRTCGGTFPGTQCVDDGPCGGSTCLPVNDPVCPDTNGDGSSDGTCTEKVDYSPFCGLVDPNWVLKAPELVCKREGAGELIQSKDWAESPNASTVTAEGEVVPKEPQVIRRTTCADEQTCIVENPDGTCQRYGYCTEETDVWRFQGESCDAQYASCQKYTKPDGTQVSYLRNTVEYNNCSADNASCKWYCQEKNSSGQWQCDYGLTSAGTQNRLSFDRDASTCSASVAGCTELIRTASGSGTNLLFDSSFELGDETSATNPTEFNNWNIATASGLVVEKTANDAYSGQYSYHLTTSGGTGGIFEVSSSPTQTPEILHTSGRYTLSVYVKVVSGQIILNLNGSTVTQGITNEWQRLSVTGELGTGTAFVAVISSGPAEYYVDAMQLERGGLTEYKDYGSVNKVYLNGSRRSCDRQDIGCAVYTPVTTGAAPVTGQITDVSECEAGNPLSCDQCPATFVGCKAFREMPVEHVPRRPAREPVSIVPTSGKSCPATQVGCEEYTNLDEVAQGGEGTEYYSYIRQCVKPDNAAANSKNFYTWIGSEEFGYQLKEFTLLRNSAGAPCTNLGVDNPAIANPAHRFPNCVDGVAFDEENDGSIEQHVSATCPASDIFTNPDCTEFYDNTGNIYYMLRSRLVFVSDDCHPFKNTTDTLENRNVTYHMVPSEGTSCQAAFAGCREYKGAAASNVRTVLTSNFENGSIAPWTSNADVPTSLNPSNNATQAGGHSMVVFDLNYPGPGMDGAKTVVDTLVKRDTAYTLSFWAAGGANNVSIEAALYDGTGTMLSLANGASAQFTGTAIARAGNWNQYTLGPLYLDVAPPTGTFLLIGGTSAFYLDNIILQEVVDDLYRIKGSTVDCSGYENCAAYRDKDQRLNYLKSFSRLCDDDAVGCEEMIVTHNSDQPFDENVQVTRRQRGDYNNDGRVDVIDRDLLRSYFATTEPGVNRADPWAIMDVNGDDSVTSADVTYLDAYIAGGPAPDPYPQTYAIPSDTIVTVINDPAVQCAASESGCTEMGKPLMDNANQVSGYETSYIINDPDTYATTMCQQDESSCQEYASDTGASYFKDPGVRTCEYKTPAGTTTPGWYRTGTSIGCGIGGTVGSISYGLVGTCPASQSGCTEYRDPIDPRGCDVSIPANLPNAGRCDAASSSPGAFCDTSAYCDGGVNDGKPCDVSNPDATCGTGVTCQADPQHAGQCGAGSCVAVASCEAYYYINNSTDATSCNGIVNDLQGCRLFYNASNPPAQYYAKGTNSGSVPSNNCDNNPQTPASPNCDSNELIKVQRDRVCSQWLECSAGTSVKDRSGSQEQVCLERMPCNKLDPVTGLCVGTRACSDTRKSCVRDSDCINGICIALDVDVTYRCSNAPSQTCVTNADCGAGQCLPANPDRACANVPSQRCDSDADCGGSSGSCRVVQSPNMTFTSSDNASNTISSIQNMTGLAKPGIDWGDGRVIEGTYPVGSMIEQGVTGPASKDMIRDGDFWDNNFLTLDEHKPNDISTLWTGNGTSFGNWSLTGSAQIKANLTELGDDGAIPGNPQLNENNILQVDPGDDVHEGLYYQLGKSISGGAQYVLSFKARYESGNITLRDRLRVEIEYLNASGVRIGGAVLGVISPTSSWQEYILGPQTVSPGSANATRLSIVQESSYCTTATTNDALCVEGGPVSTCTSIGGTCRGSGRAFYLDDVSMKPILETKQGADNKVSRTCRMYPGEDSPLCEYTDFDGVTHRGWKGYCIEKDPKNSSICLNWWPIDVITGEPNIFGQEAQAGYNDRSPLYFCEQADGVSSNAQVVIRKTSCGSQYGYCSNQPSRICLETSSPIFPTVGCEGFQGICITNACVSGTNPVSYPTESYLTTIKGFPVQSGGDLNCQPEDVDKESWDGSCTQRGGTDSANANAVENGYEVTQQLTSTITETNIDSVQIEWTENFNFVWPQVVFTLNRVRSNFVEEFPLINKNYQYKRLEQNIGGTNYVIWRVYPLESCHGSIQPGQDCLWLDLLFTPGGTLQYIRAVGEDATGGQDELGSFNLKFYLRESCTNIVKVAGDDVIAWADRVSAGSGYSVTPMGYGHTQDLSPFGSIPPLVGNPATWYGKEANTPLYVQVPYISTIDRATQTRAGSPYGCENGVCEKSRCLAGDNYGKVCDTVDAQKTCETKGGYCSGLLSNSVPVTTAANEFLPRLQRLFASALEGWTWNGLTGQYTRDDAATEVDTWQQLFTNMSICPDNRRPSDPAAANAYCAIQPQVTNFTLAVNGTEYRNDAAPAGGWNLVNIVSPGDTIKVTFTGNVDKEQMPLESILIDWNGQNDSADRKGSMSWGYAPRTDPKNPHTFFYTVPLSVTSGTVLIPHVQLVDHWGTCSNVQTSVCNGGARNGWLCQDAQDKNLCTQGGGTCVNNGAGIATRASSCANGPQDNPGWYAFNGRITVR